MPITTPQNAPASAKSLELNASPTTQSPRIAKTKTGSAARCARPHGTLTCRVQPLHLMDLLGPSDCFCQKEKLSRSHHGHLYIRPLPCCPLEARLLGAILLRRKPLFREPVGVENTFEIKR